MLTRLIRFALEQRLLVLGSALLLLVLGVRAAVRTPLDVFPEFARPLVEIQTEAPGLSTVEVESLVTVPLESALHGVPGLETLRSKSVLGLSSVVLLFGMGTDLLQARQLVAERLAAEAGRLPAVARPPVILPPLSSLSRAMKIGLSSKTRSQMDLSQLARWTIRPRLLAVPGVANVSLWGQRDRQVQVLVQPDRLRAHEVSLDAVVRAVGEATQVGAGGFIDTPNQRLALRQVAPGVAPDALSQTLVSWRSGAPIRIGDVAEVVIDHRPPIGDAVINEGSGLLLIVEKQPTANTLELTHQVEAALAALRPALPDVDVDPTIFRPAGFIERSIHNLRQALVSGCVLVVLVLLFFLRDLRSAIISLTAIPLALLAAVLVLSWQGSTLNTMFLAGLVIAVGEVVDDAIIDVENIRRQLRRRLAAAPAAPTHEGALAIVLQASLEVRSAVVYASLIVSLVFLPVFYLDGVAGAFFRPLAIAYVVSILASLAVALTVTPAMALWLLPAVSARPHPEPRLVAALHRGYRRLLPALLDRPRTALALLVGSVGLAAALMPLLGDEFLPEFKETNFLMHWVEKPGTSIEANRRATLRVSQELRRIPGVQSFGAHIGRAEVADEVVGPNFTELWISIDPEADHDATVGRIKEVVAGYPGIFRDVLTYLKERIKEVLSGASATVIVRIFGPDLAVLREQAERVQHAVADVAGVVDLKVEPQVLVPQIDVHVRPAAAALYGLTPGHIRHQLSTLIQGAKVGEIYEQQQVVDVVVWSVPAVRSDLHALARLLLETPNGGAVRLGEVATLVVAGAPNEIKREGGSRRIDVTCNVRGRDLGSVARDLQQRLAQLSFPAGYHPELLGEYAARQAAQRQLLGLGLVALLGILALLYLDFRNLRLTLLVFGSLPCALLGGVCGALLGGGSLSLGSLVGFVSVLGIAARNGILLVSHLKQLAASEGGPISAQLVLRGAEERLQPIVMTALSAGLALVPIVVRGSIPGHEIEFPLASVILGGLVSSMILNLLLLPSLYLAVMKNACAHEP